MSGDKGAEGEVELDSQNPQSRNSDLMEPSEQDDVLVKLICLILLIMCL